MSASPRSSTTASVPPPPPHSLLYRPRILKTDAGSVSSLSSFVLGVPLCNNLPPLWIMPIRRSPPPSALRCPPGTCNSSRSSSREHQLAPARRDYPTRRCVRTARVRSQTCSYYLLRRPEYQVTVASLNLWKAERFATDLPREVKCISLDLNNAEALDKAVSEHDLIISLVPYMHHAKIINSAIEFKKNVVTTSYVSPAMQAPDDEPKKAGIIGLNKIGLDSGINHL
ncbi:hypothetical protein PtA15_13A204 [Puccinia triticina]|uniref:Saccharopine dehydrogenase NADP binding domain-containing protein n=1 Tax=Puccinia triticina TaxID=208348 RepID=A0ABY7D0N8_9BASI|nr:uncharacterized protein PtA15_13A204 [Puccinia triticina]WAQ90805.1 hypothetical protein PtA15_13A204 [Puccinia triticina]